MILTNESHKDPRDSPVLLATQSFRTSSLAPSSRLPTKRCGLIKAGFTAIGVESQCEPRSEMNASSGRCFAIVPAAGESRRMGQPKLMLPWGDVRLIDQVLQAWTTSNVDRVVVVVRSNDQQLLEACQRWPVDIVQPDHAPPDMKASLQIGLRHLQSEVQPSSADRCFIAPADLPTLSRTIIDRLIQTGADTGSITLPRFGQRPGHPALFPWELTNEIFQLAANEGVNRLVREHHTIEIPFEADQAIQDVDTPEEYQAALRRRPMT